MRLPPTVCFTVVIGLIVVAVPAPTAGQIANPAQVSRQNPPSDRLATVKPGTAVISGRVVAADTGRPLRRARISVSGPSLSGPARTAGTDSEGRYAVVDLPAGLYRVNVTRSGYQPLQYGQRRVLEQGRPVEVLNGQSLEDIDFALPRMGVITGRITDELGDPIEGVMVAAKRLRYWEGRRQLVPTGSGFARSDDTGQYRILGLAPGMYYVMATTRETWTITEKAVSRVMGYAPTYFPGTTTPTDGGRVNVGLGQEVPNVDVSLVPGRAASLSGTAVDSRGVPFRSVVLRQEMRGEGFASFGSVANATVAASGAFTIREVPPGDYKLTASTGPDVDRPEAVVVPIVVDSGDIADLALIGSEGGFVTGRVVTDTGEIPRIPQLRVAIGAPVTGQTDTTLSSTFRTPGQSDVAADGTFSIKGVFGRSRVRVTLPSEWMVKAILHDGRDLTDRPIELGSGETLAGIEIVVSNRVNTVSGELLDDKGRPTVDGTILLFPEDRTQWGEDSRKVRAVRPDTRGRYQLRGLSPGEYLVIAVDYVEDGMWNDPEYLDSIQRYGQKMTLGEAEAKTLSLKLVSP